LLGKAKYGHSVCTETLNKTGHIEKRKNLFLMIIDPGKKAET
jgi:hypothetical protein